MELYHLRSFVAVAREGHLTRAARRLHTSQPAVSAHVRTLEEELGLRLFERTPRGMRLTNAGRELLAPAEEVLAGVAGLEARARGLAGSLAGSLVIGVRSDAAMLRLDAIYRQLADRHPGIGLALLQAMSAQVIEQVGDRRMDAGFVFGPWPRDRFDGLLLTRVRVRVIGPPGWQERLARADWQDLAAMPWVWTPEDCPFHLVARSEFEGRGLAPARVIEADSEATIASLVASGVGLGLQLEAGALRARDAGRVSLWERGALAMDLSFIHLRERGRDPLLQAVVAAVRRAWQPEICA